MNAPKLRRLAVATLMLTASVQASAENMEEIGGRNAAQEFTDPHLVALALSACAGDIDGIDAALESGADPNGKGREGETPLFWALKCQNLAGIEALLKAGADPNYRVPGHFSATWAVSTFWNPAPLKLLLRYRGDPNAVSVSDETALWKAFEVGFHGHGWDNYYALLDAGADINRANEVGDTIAVEAAALFQFDKVEELLKRGYDYDPVRLGVAVQPRQNEGAAPSEPAGAQARVMEMLRMRGVVFPVPALLKLYAGYARMTEDKSLILNWYGGKTENDANVRPHTQIIKLGESDYVVMLNRIGGLKPRYGVGIPRRPEDPVPFPFKRPM